MEGCAHKRWFKLRLSGTCVFNRLTCPRKFNNTIKKLADSREKKRRIKNTTRAVLTFLKKLLCFFFLPLFVVWPPYYSAKYSAFFVTISPFILSKSKKIKKMAHPSKRSLKIFLNITLLFANFELHCDSYTFSLRLNLKQLNNSQFMMNEHATKNISQRSLALTILP